MRALLTFRSHHGRIVWLCPTFSSLRYRTALASAVFYISCITLAGPFPFPGVLYLGSKNSTTCSQASVLWNVGDTGNNFERLSNFWGTGVIFFKKCGTHAFLLCRMFFSNWIDDGLKNTLNSSSVSLSCFLSLNYNYRYSVYTVSKHCPKHSTLVNTLHVSISLNLFSLDSIYQAPLFTYHWKIMTVYFLKP